MRRMNDEKLMEKAQEGDFGAFATIVERHKEKLMAFAASYVRWDLDQAQEILQAAFVQAFEKRLSFDCARPLAPWLFGVVRNSALRWIRQKRNQVPLENVETILVSLDSPEEEAIRLQRAFHVSKMVGRLPRTQREVVTLIRQGFRHGEVAVILGITEVSARNNLCHALKTLRAEAEKGRTADGL